MISPLLKNFLVSCLTFWLPLFFAAPAFGQVLTATDGVSTFEFSNTSPTFGVRIAHPVPSLTQDNSTNLFYTFSEDPNSLPRTATVELYTISVGIGQADLVSASFGDEFSGFTGSAFTSAPIGEEFYLGISVFAGFGGADGGPLFEPGLGWAKFLIDGNTLEPAVLDSFIVYGGNAPVTIGSTSVPEPSGITLLAIVASAISLRRKRNP